MWEAARHSIPSVLKSCLGRYMLNANQTQERWLSSTRDMFASLHRCLRCAAMALLGTGQMHFLRHLQTNERQASAYIFCFWLTHRVHRERIAEGSRKRVCGIAQPSTLITPALVPYDGSSSLVSADLTQSGCQINSNSQQALEQFDKGVSHSVTAEGRNFSSTHSFVFCYPTLRSVTSLPTHAALSHKGPLQCLYMDLCTSAPVHVCAFPPMLSRAENMKACARWVTHRGLLSKCEALLREQARRKPASGPASVTISSLLANCWDRIKSCALEVAMATLSDDRQCAAALKACLSLAATERKPLTRLAAMEKP